MIDTASHAANLNDAEAVLLDALANAERASGAARSFLAQAARSPASDDVSEETRVRTYAALASLAVAVLDGLVGAAGARHQPAEVDVVIRVLSECPALLEHLRADVIEWQLTQRLHDTLALDPVAPPLLQQLVAQPDHRAAATAFLTAQMYWCRAHARMNMTLGNLPYAVQNQVCGVIQALGASEPDLADRANIVCADVRSASDPAADRERCSAKVLELLGLDAPAALRVQEAGVALFLTALARRTMQSRTAVAGWTDEAQAARLAVSLRAAGTDPGDIRQQLLALHFDDALAEGLAQIAPQQASDMLADMT
ncbi:hypothetical protein [Novosphingobium sp. Leaf2]|uniref:hypothetical protein n=1 Tax=Novosphingobium sp. Leaf2 TaxID=1735670 RepID=UPI0006F70715|nr:hypothetical protein [Novosphingobium sp. Leaf2]KQM17380.1 hypothetical protein ASE49_09960 [Novosphingobium sp. Leaf2]